MKTVLVTGATGFIGNHVINTLLQLNDIKIIATSKTHKKALKASWYDQVIYIPFDLNNNVPELFEFFHSPNIIIHLAWEGLPSYNDNIHIKKNLFNNYRFLNQLMHEGCKDITCIGTCFEYGLQNGELSEKIIPNPITNYGIAKDTLRKFIELQQTTSTFVFKWIRLFYMYGEGQSEKSLMGQLNKAIEQKEKTFNMSKGDQLRDYLAITDVAKHICNIALQTEISGIINCGSGVPVSIRSLVESELLAKKYNLVLNLGYYDYPNYEPIAFWADITKLNTIKKKYAR